MFHKPMHVPEAQDSEFLDLNRDDIRDAIVFAQTEGLSETEEALIDLLLLMEEVSNEGGNIEYRIAE